MSIVNFLKELTREFPPFVLDGANGPVNHSITLSPDSERGELLVGVWSDGKCHEVLVDESDLDDCVNLVEWFKDFIGEWQ